MSTKKPPKPKPLSFKQALALSREIVDKLPAHYPSAFGVALLVLAVTSRSAERPVPTKLAVKALREAIKALTP